MRREDPVVPAVAAKRELQAASEETNAAVDREEDGNAPEDGDTPESEDTTKEKRASAPWKGVTDSMGKKLSKRTKAAEEIHGDGSPREVGQREFN
ncbi:hypothetical protein DY000_02033547 [Brassica cretica]|uniref:Uncharacterized protein n=1 Tax=Brassica cretica TaxID=69181 RepID=A0ABQ7DMA2_BRACR|nr:hypothetical protein DY000_02033547 [Brassica cretica]